MSTLNRIKSNWSFEERERLNQNWTIIENYLSGLQGQINLLSGDVDVQGLIDQINDILNQGNTVIDDLETALQGVTTVIANAQDATNGANTAAQNALDAIADTQNIINDFGSRREYNNTTTYKRNNFVYKDGCSYVYINNTPSAGNPPPPYPTISNDHWHILADKGASGGGAVSKVNGKEPNGSGEITLEPPDIGAASSTDLSDLEQQVTKHLDEEATETELGHVKQSANNVAETVARRDTKGILKATGGTSTNDVLAMAWRGATEYTTSATLVSPVLSKSEDTVYLLTVKVGIAADNTYDAMYLVNLHGDTNKLTPIVALSTDSYIDINGADQVVIIGNTSANRTIYATLFRII